MSKSANNRRLKLTLLWRATLAPGYLVTQHGVTAPVAGSHLGPGLWGVNIRLASLMIFLRNTRFKRVNPTIRSRANLRNAAALAP